MLIPFALGYFVGMAANVFSLSHCMRSKQFEALYLCEYVLFDPRRYNILVDFISTSTFLSCLLAAASDDFLFRLKHHNSWSDDEFQILSWLNFELSAGIIYSQLTSLLIFTECETLINYKFVPFSPPPLFFLFYFNDGNFTTWISRRTLKACGKSLSAISGASAKKFTRLIFN